MTSRNSRNKRSNGSVPAPERNVQQTLNEAVRRHREGDLVGAQDLYRCVLADEPNHFDSLHLLGVATSQQGDHAAAIIHIDAALAINPNAAEALGNRAIALKALGRVDEALASFDQAIAAKPDYADALNNKGLTLKELGRLSEAVVSFDAAIALQPRFAEAFYNKGRTLAVLKKFERAIASLDQAIALKPRYPEAFCHRAHALTGLGRLDEALAGYETALALKPDYAEARNARAALANKQRDVPSDAKRHADALVKCDHAIRLDPGNPIAFNNRGIALKGLQRFEDALVDYDKAIALKPNYADAFSNRGNVLKALQRFDEAVASYDQALALDPRHVDALINRGNVLHEMERFDDALASYDSALAIDPSSHDALNNRGVTLKTMHRVTEALASYDKVLALKPNHVSAFNNRGVALKKIRRLEEALENFDRAIALNPKYVGAFLNRGNTLLELKRIDDAIADYDRALALKPGAADAFLYRCMARLLAGRYAEGWLDYEARWDAKGFPHKRPALDAPEWQGEDVAGRRIVVYSEQGLGDTIQFARYARLLAERGAHVALLAPGKLRRLLRALGSDIEILSSKKGNLFDFGCALMSLPMRFGTNETSIPREVPYLKSEQGLVDRWRQAIGNHGFKIGIAWQGTPDKEIDRGRSIPLIEFARLARVPGVRLISLQKNHGLDQLRSLAADVPIETLSDDFDSGQDAFVDCAAVMSHLDLIITSDTSVAHLAGALARPTFLALKYVPDWRWLLDREDSPWYPTMRLFRQKTDGDWDGVFSDIEQEVRSLLIRANGGGSMDRHDALSADTGAPSDVVDASRGKTAPRSRLTRRLLDDAVALHQAGRLDEAETIYRKVLEGQPNSFDAFHLLGVIDSQRGNYRGALEKINEALKLNPASADAFNNHGNVLRKMARPSEALASYDRAIDLAPGLAEAWNNRGNTLTELGRLAEALASFDRAIALRPDYADAFYNRGNALRKSKRVDEAISSYDRAIALEPKHAEAYMCRGIARLLSGHYPDGWSDYEWRFKIRESQIRRPEIDAHVWQGQSLLGRSIAVFTEQGLGDTIQFARYLPLLAQRGAQVSLLAPTELCRLFRPLNRQIKIINSIEQGQTFDFQCALMSLPLQLGTDLNSVPNQIPYLTPEAERVSHWKTRIGSQGFRIGIAWQGKPQSAIDRGRSIPLSAFIRLARLPGVRLISLQKHDGLEQLWSVPDKVAIETLGDNFDSGPDAFIDCAAVMANLDLVITSDTAIAHLAGALGRPTWVALRKVPDWRWLLEREDSPWYPTMRLFRQTTDGDWADVFSEIEQSLQVLLREQPARREEILHNVKETSIQTGQATEIKGKLLLENANLRLKQCKDGLMMYYANDMFIGRSMDLYGEFSAGEADVFQQLLRPGMTVVDVGANIGTHTLYFANTVERGGRVYAFEPQRFIYNVLCGNVALNGHTNVVAVNAALGSKPGQITVPALDYGRGGNFGGLSLGLNRKGENVPMLTLDSYGLSSCQLIKIDVEGMEKQVLEGAVSLLQAHQPFLYVENDREKNSQELIGWLLARNYRLYWHLPRMFNPNNFFGEKQNVFGNIASINMLCAPASKSFTTNLREITSPQDSWRSR